MHMHAHLTPNKVQLVTRQKREQKMIQLRRKAGYGRLYKCTPCMYGGFKKSRLKKKKLGAGRHCTSGSFLRSLCHDPLAPVVLVSLAVRPLLSLAGAVQLLQSLLTAQNFTARVVLVAGVEGGAPERGDPPEGGVGDAPDHSSSTCRRLGERGF